MTNINRTVIHLICRYSNLAESSADRILKEHVYNDKLAWQKFLQLFFISLAVCFTTAGIIFFFAYNWVDLHKFVKIGMMEGLIVGTTLIVLFSNIKLVIKNIILTGSSVLVGVLFAVYGQIYQTGANAYDFFLGWTLFITLWVIVSEFAPLWLVYMGLINTTIILYSQQVARDWSLVFVFMLLLIFNAIFLILPFLLSKFRDGLKVPVWFSNIIALACVSYATIGIIFGIFERHEPYFIELLIITAIFYAVGIVFGIKWKSVFYLSIIPFSLIIIASALFLKISDGEAMFLFVSLFIIATVTLLIKSLITIQKKWTNG